MRMLFVLLVVCSMPCMAQEYYCPVSRAADGTAFKTDMWLVVGDTTVALKSIHQGKPITTSFARESSTNPSVIYYTDGVMTTRVSVLETPGTVKGTKYTHVLVMQTDAEAGGSSLTLYCTIIPDK